MSAISYVWCEDCQCSHEPGTHSQIAMAHGLGPRPKSEAEVDAVLLAAARAARHRPIDPTTPLDESLLDAQRIAGLMVEQMQELAKRVEMLQSLHRKQHTDLSYEHVQRLTAQRDELSAKLETLRQFQADSIELGRTLDRVVEVLSAFVHAPISISSLQPVLDLAVELNPSLKERR